MRHDREVRRTDPRGARRSPGLKPQLRECRRLELRPTRMPGLELRPARNLMAKSSALRIAKGARRLTPFASIEDAIDAIRKGRMIVVVDDEDRENEGDLTMAASTVTADAINFMAKYGRGQICLSMTGQRLDELEIPLAVSSNTTL